MNRGVSVCSVSRWFSYGASRVLEQKPQRPIEIIGEAGSRRRYFGNGGPVYTINI
jgi:hypothetical protein